MINMSSDLEVSFDEVYMEYGSDETGGEDVPCSITACQETNSVPVTLQQIIGQGRRSSTTDQTFSSESGSGCGSGSSSSASLFAEPCRSLSTVSNKPHKAQDRAWEAIRSVAAASGGVGLGHFRFLQRLGSGDIGQVFLTELQSVDNSPSNCFFAMKVMDKHALAGRNKLQRAQTEREILEVLDHPFLPTLYAHIDDGRHSCLVMEFCPGGDLHVLRQLQPNKHFTINAVRFYAAEVLLTLEYLHMMGVVYRDLKPENVLVREDGHIMLSDFDLSLKCTVNPTLMRAVSTANPHGWTSPLPGNGGLCNPGAGSTSCMAPLGCISPCSVHPVASCLPLPRIVTMSVQGRQHKTARHHHPESRRVSSVMTRKRLPELLAEPTSARSMSFVGTHEYLAPEIILGEGHGSAVDWWTFGIFLYELLYSRTPFKGVDNDATLTNVVTQLLRFPSTSRAEGETHVQIRHVGSCPMDQSVDPEVSLQDLIRGLLVKDPQKRLGATRGASEIKQHRFFEGVNWALIRCATPPEIPPPFHRMKHPAKPSIFSFDCKLSTDTSDDNSCGGADVVTSASPEFEMF
ncbi:hypothetical protein KP509_07G031700 [Ceratopteris richardii]|uniref:non-specific serine/threonine protein kinase n=1 Tax=Ceratopteris richardii TaxID=49495 RepID=A0A8T2UD95_CERRI|nr:hypothetical protein KP509_07G031700 [Ceratopteris richardii]KAH7432630.1 hypothetical protein KP509_07G031700 [Ceratopteris richardii]KAH7432631.1 hypothetical protein KP509_07G031700 [Ceratopteris richardii]KAH7432632.1 hypothetical protein KP509_07G031700 [Ceratopteris richardii]KAH7432633.1 hypothetical protein KP509_07G031700 [Ceratopteris richardii]